MAPTIKSKNKKSRLRRISDWLHLWLGITSGLIVLMLGVTGCMYVFQKEITELIHRKAYFVDVPSNAKTLPLSLLQTNAEKALGNKKKIGFISTYKAPERAWEFSTYKAGDPKAFWYFDSIDYYDLVLVNPYTGKVTLVTDHKYEFFSVVKMIHWSLLINHPIGQQIIGWSTFIFVFLLISGMVMWWPKNLKKSNFDKSFKVKWKAKFKRINYDMHNVLGFYAMLICLMLALTGLVWAFQWFQATVYVVASGSTTPPKVVEIKSDSTKTIRAVPFDIAFDQAKKIFKNEDRIGMSPAGGGTATINATGYRGEETYWNYDVLQFDQYSGKLLHRTNQSEKNGGETVIGMNYDIHVGAILGLPGKILAFFASLIAASLPITGFIIWWGKGKKKNRIVSKPNTHLIHNKMKFLNLILVLTGLITLNADAQTKVDTPEEKLEKDRKAIKSLAGFYEVNFNYGEVTAPDPNYKFSKPYESHGNEWAEIIVDEPKRIVIQHMLAINDSTVIKHWRQDWTYEDTNIMLYTEGNAWKKGNLTPADVKGKWTQKVYQVDDSPRYQGYGTWSHVGGHDSWSSETDSPLPRRESTVRKDYNVLNRGSRITITKNGWMFEQDNKKIVRAASGDKLLAVEKGYEEFTKIDPKTFAYAQKWWASQHTFWADVRGVWADIIDSQSTFKVQTMANGKLLYETLFNLGDQSIKEKWTAAQNKEKIKTALQPYLVK